MIKIKVLTLFIFLVFVFLGLKAFTPKPTTKAPEKTAQQIPKSQEVKNELPLLEDPVKLFYPPNGSLLKSKRVTFFGKIAQSKDKFLLNYTFKKEKLAYNEDDFIDTFNFIPDTEKNFIIWVDGQIAKDVQTLPQFPKVYCFGQTETSNKETCLKDKQEHLPPVLFFVTRELPPGKHELKVQFDNKEYSSSFNIEKTIDNKKEDSLKKLLETHKSEEFETPIFNEDTCYSGWYFPKDFLHIPIPNIASNEVFLKF